MKAFLILLLCLGKTHFSWLTSVGCQRNVLSPHQRALVRLDTSVHATYVFITSKCTKYYNFSLYYFMQMALTKDRYMHEIIIQEGHLQEEGFYRRRRKMIKIYASNPETPLLLLFILLRCSSVTCIVISVNHYVHVKFYGQETRFCQHKLIAFSLSSIQYRP